MILSTIISSFYYKSFLRICPQHRQQPARSDHANKCTFPIQVLCRDLSLKQVIGHQHRLRLRTRSSPSPSRVQRCLNVAFIHGLSPAWHLWSGRNQKRGIASTNFMLHGGSRLYNYMCEGLYARCEERIRPEPRSWRGDTPFQQANKRHVPSIGSLLAGRARKLCFIPLVNIIIR